MNGQSFIRKGFLAVLCMLFLSVSGCGAIGSDSQITQMNQAFLPDATDRAGELMETQVPSSVGDDSAVPEENQPGENGTFASGKRKDGSDVGNGKAGKSDNAVTDGTGGGKGNKDSSDAGGNKNSNTKESSRVGSSPDRGIAAESNRDNNRSADNGNKKPSSKANRDTVRLTPTKEPKSTPVPAVKQQTCTISIDCQTILGNMDKLNSAKKPFVPEDGIILPETLVKLQQGDTVFDILSRVCKERDIHMESSYTPLYGTYYVEGIHQLYEFDCGKDMSGWKYFVNGVSANYSCSKYEVKAGDVICWRYTCDGGKDLEDRAADN